MTPATIDRVQITPDLWAMIRRGITPASMPVEIVGYLRTETSFKREDPTPDKLLQADRMPVALGKKVCPLCHGAGRVANDFVGVTTGIRASMLTTCICMTYCRLYRRWQHVPRQAQHIRLRNLETLAAYFKRSFKGDSFKGFVADVNEYRSSSMLLAGDAGTGKTTLLIALYHEALKEWALAGRNPTDAVWLVNARELSEQFRSAERSEDSQSLPAITVNKVQAAIRAGYRPRLFLEEIDKIKLDSTFQLAKFQTLLDSIFSEGGQVVATSNLSEKELIAAIGDQYGTAIVRRISGEPTGVLIDFNAAKVTSRLIDIKGDN